MGYESKVIIVERKEFPRDGERSSWVSAIPVAEYDLCKLGWENQAIYNKAFRREIDYRLWMPSVDKDGNEIMADVNEDGYGDHLKAAELPELISALEKIAERDNYWRLPPLISMLKAFAASGVNGLEAVHYGY